MDLLSYMTGFGLATGAGGRAALVLFALGVFNRTEYFSLSEEFLWIGSLPVMAVLGVLSLVEILADLHPDISELQDVAGYAPSVVAGFIAMAASTGDVDSSVLQLAASGILGGGTAVATRYCRNQVSSLFRDVSDGTTEGVHKVRSIGETGAVLGIAGSAFLLPALVVLFLVVLVGTTWFFFRKKSREEERNAA
jgi:hypothetical protein